MAEHNVNTVKAQIQSLINKANETTGNTDTNLTDGVNALVSGYGQGGSSGGGSASLNIHYGDTEPSDTSMLWCKCTEPTSVKASPNTTVSGSRCDINAFSTMYNNYTNYRFGITTIGSKIYVCQGLMNGSTSGHIYIYDVASDSWNPMYIGTEKYDVSASSLGSNIYVFGGYYWNTKSKIWDMSNEITKANIDTTEYTTLTAKLPVGMRCANTVTVGTKIYIFGGNTTSGYINSISVLDTETETITTLSVTLPENLMRIGVVAIGTKIYLFGGNNGSSYSKTINVFDTETETITTLTTELPQTLSGMGVGAIGNKIYLIGGQINSGSCSNVIYVFETDTETISALPITLPNAIGLLGVGVVDENLYVFGGSDSSGTANNSVLKVSIEDVVSLEYGNVLVQTNSLKNFFNIINGGILIETGVSKVYKGNSENQGELVEAYLYQNGTWTQI